MLAAVTVMVVMRHPHALAAMFVMSAFEAAHAPAVLVGNHPAAWHPHAHSIPFPMAITIIPMMARVDDYPAMNADMIIAIEVRADDHAANEPTDGGDDLVITRAGGFRGDKDAAQSGDKGSDKKFIHRSSS